jgi:hypothetical protein
MMHRCPGPGCDAQVPYEMLACRRHWYQVPRAIRNAIYHAWADGAGSGSDEHLAAMDAAIARMRPL